VKTRLPSEPHVDPHLFGTLCGLFSALIYTCANSFLRAVHHCDPVWVSAIRAVPTVLIMAPVLVLLAASGRRVLPGPKFAGLIVLGGLCGQLGGNICFQTALHIIGVALAVPLTMGGMIVAAAIFGRVFLAEPLTPRVLLALAILLAAIGVLALGAGDAGQSMAVDRHSVAESRDGVAGYEVSPWRLAAGVAAGCGAGVFYSILNAILRYCVTRGTPLPSALFIVSTVGAACLSGLAWLRIGPAGMSATTPADFAIMLAAGVCNTVAFLALTKSLQLNSIVYVNALNATQATLAAIAGVVIFGEKLSSWLVAGIALTVIGLMALAKAHRAMRAVEAS
jgi:drug/metabolite transporter (DMT)-like permease